MGELVEINKQQKNSTLFQTAFDIFSNKGFAGKTTISDIVNQGGACKRNFLPLFQR